MRLLSPHRRTASAARREPSPGPATTVAPVGASAALAARLEGLASRIGTFRLVPGAPRTEDGEAPELDPDVEVAFVSVADDDARGVSMVRALHRAHPRMRVVVSGDGVDWFEDAFDFGADAWVDRSADDETVLAAIHGPTSFLRGGRRRT